MPLARAGFTPFLTEKTGRVGCRALLLGSLLIGGGALSGWAQVRSNPYTSHRPTTSFGTDATGHPLVYGLHNTEAAQGTRTQSLYGQNATGLFLNGGTKFVAGKLGLWDGGQVLTTHRELAGRVQMRNAAATLSDHATHLAGTLVAQGLTPEARGMAYGATLSVWDYTNDLVEVTAAAPSLLVSVHAYGPLSGWVQNLTRPGTIPAAKWEWWGNTTVNTTEDYLFGFYTTKARDIDRVLYANPNLLMVRSADNKRTENGPPANTPYYLNSSNQQSTLPRSLNNSYDIIPGEATAKNVLTVGAGEVLLNADNDPTRLTVSPYSGWGPTDDGRIKPDLLGVGTGIYSTLSGGTSAYGTNTGTSMAAANVGGSLLLIQELFARQTNGRFLRSATLKGLAIHTADRLRPATGPDYRQGWGLLNTEAAADVVLNPNQSHQISEATLIPNQTWTATVVADGSEPLIATLCWTDPEGAVSPLVPASLNNRTPKLVNDLDMRLVGGGQTAFPFVLNPARPADPALRADNPRDNVEQIYIEKPVPGQAYTVQVTYKGALHLNAAQPFSVIVTGRKHSKCILPNLQLMAKPDTLICAGSTLRLQTEDRPGVRYAWLRDGVQIQQADTPECPVFEAGAYTLRYTDRNGCTGLSTPVQVRLFTPAVQLTPVAYQFLCPDQQPTQLVATVSYGASVSWLRDGQPLSSGVVSTSLTLSQPGTYQAQVTQNGCETKSKPVLVQTADLANLTILPNEAVVQLPAGATTQLQGPVGTQFAYQWFRDKVALSGATASRIIINQPGAYRLRVNQQQCLGWADETQVRRAAPTDSVRLVAEAGLLEAYPVPVLTRLLIRYQHGLARQVTATIYNETGQLEKADFPLRQLPDGRFSLDLPVTDLPNGLHILQVQDGPRRRSLRFIKAN